MYEQHFDLKESPFGLTPNTAYFLNVQGHRQAFNMLQVALSNGEGFIKVVGEVGTGKTMLCRKLLNTLDKELYYTAYIPNPFLNSTALYRAIAEELGLNSNPLDGINELQRAINHRLVELVGEGKKVVLVIDEAQSMPTKSLEALRLISNLETETTKLIHIVLFGQQELDTLLTHHNLRQLQQRITFAYQLPPMDFQGTRDYIRHRISTAGFNKGELFPTETIKLIYRASMGVPRLINILCHKAMMAAYGSGDQRINSSHVMSAVRDTQGVRVPGLSMPWLVGACAVVATLTITALFVIPRALS